MEISHGESKEEGQEESSCEEEVGLQPTTNVAQAALVVLQSSDDARASGHRRF
jgi:hypothetical protein